MSNLKRDGKLRWAPSYLRRQGQMTPGQKRAFRELWPTYGIEFRYDEVLDLESIFSGGGPMVLEIGFGMGENLIHLAKANPETRFLGIEVHKPGLGAALLKIESEGVENVRLMRGDARLILSDHLEGQLFEKICVFFPDPWPREGDAHRRLIQPGMLEVIEERIEPKGILHLATDVAVYADHVSKIMASRAWESLDAKPFAEQRARTQYQEKGIEKGHAIHDLVWRLK